MADGTLVSELETRIRRQVNDESSRRFASAAVMEKLSLARRHVADVFGRINEAGYFEKELVEAQIAAGGTYLASIPTDFLGIKTLNLVMDPVALGGTGQDVVPVDRIRRDQISDFRTRVPIATSRVRRVYWVRRAPDPANVRIFVLPVNPSATGYFNLLYHHGFADLASPAAGNIGSPIEFDELLVLHASILLEENDKKKAGEWKEEYASKEGAKLTALQGSEAETETEQVSSEYHEEFNSGYY